MMKSPIIFKRKMKYRRSASRRVCCSRGICLVGSRYYTCPTLSGYIMRECDLVRDCQLGRMVDSWLLIREAFDFQTILLSIGHSPSLTL